MRLFHELRERRVVPAVGVYVGGSWVLVEILDRLTERYLLSPYITDIAFWALYSLLPAVILIAWTHGKPGKDQVTRAELVGVPVNLIATLGLLVTVFGGKDLGSTAERVTVENELGEREMVLVPRESHRVRLAVFFFAQEGDAPESGWSGYAVAELLVQDLQQNPFLVVHSPWETMGHGYYARAKQAGFGDAIGLPLNFMREIAEAANRPYFLSGTIEQGEDGVTVRARIWKTESLEVVAEVREQGDDLLRVVDRLSRGVREALNVPSGSGRLAQDLPLSETYGESESALRSYIAGRNALLFDNDRESSNRHYQAAIEADPGFVFAWLMLSVNQAEQGDFPAAQQSLARVKEMSFRLPSRDQVIVRLLDYQFSGQQDRLEALLRLQVQLHGDVDMQRKLAAILALAGRLEEARAEYQAVLLEDTTDFAIWLAIAEIERALGNPAAARENALRYHELRPQDQDGALFLGDLALESGDFNAGREYFGMAQLLGASPFAPTLRLAQLAMRQGDFGAARELLEEARALATGAGEHSNVLGFESMLELRLGRIGRAIELVEAQAPHNAEAYSPLQQLFAYVGPYVSYKLMVGEVEAAAAAVEAARSSLQPPLDRFLAFAEADVLAYQGRFEAARAAVAQGREVVEQFNAGYMAFQVPLAEALIARMEGRFEAAGNAFSEGLAKAERSVLGAAMRPMLPLIQGHATQMYVRAGLLDRAQEIMDRGFTVDAAEPVLWVGRAMQQRAQGQPALARASLDYALAIWANADPEYAEYRLALALREELAAAGAGAPASTG